MREDTHTTHTIMDTGNKTETKQTVNSILKLFFMTFYF